MEEANNSGNKNNKLMVIGFVLIGLVLIAVGIFLTTKKDNKLDNTNDTNNSEVEDIKNSIPKEKIHDYYVITEKLDTVAYDGVKQDIYLVENGPERTLMINGVSAFVSDSLSNEIMGILQMDKYILVITRGSSFTAGSEIKVFDLQGNLVKDFDVIEGNNVKVVTTSFLTGDGSTILFRITGNKLRFQGHQLMEGNTVVIKAANDEIKYIDVCSKDELNSYGIQEDSVMSAEYDLVYTESKGFEIELVKGTEMTFGNQWKYSCN